MINDEYLIDIAKALNGETVTNVSYVGFGSTSMTITPTLTSIDGELLPRSSSTNSRDASPGNVFEAQGTKSGSSITSPTGVYLYSAALFNASTSGTPRAVVSLPGLLQTTNFDVETIWDITISRR